MDALNIYYKNALLDDLCDEYRGRWRSAKDNKLELLKLSLCQQSIPHVCTYAYQGKGLTKEYIKENYSEYINGYTVHDADNVSGYTYGLYVDYDYDNELIVDKDVCSLMWCDDVQVVVPLTKATTIYVSNNSHINLVCDGYNSVRIYLFDESTVTLDDIDEDSNVIIHRYGDDAKVNVGQFCLSEKVREFRKQLKL